MSIPDIIIPWRGAWRLVPPPWQSPDARWQRPFLTRATPGHIGQVGGAGWQLVIAPETADGTWDLRANGARFFAPGQIEPILRLAVPAPGLLVGDASGDVAVELTADDAPVQMTGRRAEVESVDGRIVLDRRLRDGRLQFALATGCDDASVAESALRRNEADGIDEWLAAVREPIHAFLDAQAGLPDEDRRLVSIASEELLAKLRPPRDAIPFTWSASSAGEVDVLSIRDLPITCAAWAAIHPPVVSSILKAALSAQRDSGQIPAIIRPNGMHVVETAPPPVLAQMARLAWRVDRNTDFHEYALPRLQSYLSWLIAELDREWTGMPTWREESEAWIPEIYDARVITVDCSAMLAAEIDALDDFARSASGASPILPELAAYRDMLRTTLRTSFWDPATRRFADRTLEGQPVRRITLSAATPILTTAASDEERASLLGLLGDGGPLLTTDGARAWEPWPDDPQPPPIREADQVLLMDALRRNDANTDADRLRDALAAGARAWAGDGPLTDAGALSVISIAHPVVERTLDLQMPVWLRRLDENRAKVTILLTLLLVGGLLTVIGMTTGKRKLTVQAVDASKGLASRYYVEGRFEDALAIYSDIEANWARHPGIALARGNTLYRMGRVDDAIQAYEQELAGSYPAAVAAFNAAVVKLRSGRHDEALRAYQRVTNDFARIAPDIAARARLAVDLLNRAPPK